MDPTVVISLTALLLAALTFAATQFGNKRTATASYVTSLEKRVEALEQALKVRDMRIVELEGENLRLMRRLLANGGSHA